MWGAVASQSSVAPRHMAEPAAHPQGPQATAPEAAGGAPFSGGPPSGTPGMRQTTPTAAAAPAAAAAFYEGRGRSAQASAGAYARKAAGGAGAGMGGDPWASVATPLGAPHPSTPIKGGPGFGAKASPGRTSCWVTVWAALMTAVNVGLVIVMARMGAGGYAVDPLSHFLLQHSEAGPDPIQLAMAPTASGNVSENTATLAGTATACSCPPAPAIAPPAPCESTQGGASASGRTLASGTGEASLQGQDGAKATLLPARQDGAKATLLPARQDGAKATLLPARSQGQLATASRPLTLSEALHTIPQCTKPAFATTGASSAWHSLKGIPAPAECRVQGFVIESLEAELNFRRPYTLRITGDPEDKTHILPYLRAFQDTSMATRRRRILLDLGGNYFQTSVLWFMRNYPLDFTEVHVFESVRGRFRKPRPGKPIPNLVKTIDTRSHATTQALQVPKWALDRIHLHELLVGTRDKRDAAGRLTAINITRFMRDALQLRREDAVVVKMDIEHAEWDVLGEWLASPEMPYIVDDLFVEMHYRHYSMFGFNWRRGPPREMALTLFQRLRSKGFFVHPWP